MYTSLNWHLLHYTYLLTSLFHVAFSCENTVATHETLKSTRTRGYRSRPVLIQARSATAETKRIEFLVG